MEISFLSATNPRLYFSSGIPSSTLYKIARREGIRLAAPFNAAPTTWTQDDLEKALDAIRTGQTSVQKAATEFGIPTGTLYGRCKREKIELSRSNPAPWSQDAMSEALEAVRYTFLYFLFGMSVTSKKTQLICDF